MILVVDDDVAIRSSLSLLLRQHGYQVVAAENPCEAIAVIRTAEPDLIILDMNYTTSTSGDEGITLLRQVKLFRPNVPVILVTGWGSIQLAVKGVKAGAFDFITKPWNNETLMATIKRAIALNAKNSDFSANTDRIMLNAKFDFGRIVGTSPKLMDVLKTVARVSKTDAPVLITGESGTGKELIAEAIHTNSLRNKAPMVKVNLGGISQSLFESEMFGHRKGAFTDAYTDRIGRFALANRGTIFLDEVGELELTSQVKLLRVLQEQMFEVLGESKPTKVDVRVVCATNRDLSQMVLDGTFREDLFYRINLITIHLPALRERPEDIPILANYFLEQLQQAVGYPISLSRDADMFLMHQPFKGNIRELKNLIERTVLISGKRIVGPDDLSKNLGVIPKDPLLLSKVQPIDDLERELIVKALEMYNGNISKAAHKLGLSRAALYRRLEKHGLKGN